MRDKPYIIVLAIICVFYILLIAVLTYPKDRIIPYNIYTSDEALTPSTETKSPYSSDGIRLDGPQP